MYSQAYLYLFSSLFIYVVLSLFISVIMDTYEIVKHGHERGYPATRYRTQETMTTSQFWFSHLQFGYVINILIIFRWVARLVGDGWLGWFGRWVARLVWEMGG
jgi:hypothetical protein